MNDNEMAMEALKWIISDVSERKEEAEREEHDDFTKGRGMAYEEIYEMIKSRLNILDIQITE